MVTEDMHPDRRAISEDDITAMSAFPFPGGGTRVLSPVLVGPPTLSPCISLFLVSFTEFGYCGSLLHWHWKTSLTGVCLLLNEVKNLRKGMKVEKVTVILEMMFVARKQMGF